MTSARNFGEVELTEFIGIKAGYEFFNKKYRKNHRELEKSGLSLNKSFEKSDSVKTFKNAFDLIDRVMNAVCGTKRKAESIFSEEMDLVNSCKRRIDHLKEVHDIEGKSLAGNLAAGNHLRSSISLLRGNNIFLEEPKFPELRSLSRPLSEGEQSLFVARFYRLLTDHLFAFGHYKSALSLARATATDQLGLAEIYQEAVFIADALKAGNTEPAHTWLNEANFKLKKSQNFFEFDLRTFEFYKLVKDEKRIDAILHARRYLSGVQKPGDYQATKLGQAMVLLALRTASEVETKAMENELTESWIVKRFHNVFLDFYSLSLLTPFSLAVKAGATAIKTHFCYSRSGRHPDCVVCHPVINRFARNLPFGHHDHSVLTCFYTGLPMDDENPPMSLPNGFVYSEKAIAELATPDGMLTCPRSGEKFPVSTAQRVFIL